MEATKLCLVKIGFGFVQCASKTATASARTIVDDDIDIGLSEFKLKLLSTGLGLAATIVASYVCLRIISSVLDPTREEKQESKKRADALLQKVGIVNPKFKLNEYEMCIACNLLTDLDFDTSWNDIGGLENIINEIKQTVILPFKHRALFRGSKLLQPPKGVLLYGPPGCGKTLIAKATAKAAGARFINLQLSSLVDKWYGESQKRAEAVFTLAVKLQPTIIFIDEIDSLLRSRTSTDHEATNMIKTQFMSLWDGVLTNPNLQVMVMGATNRPQDVDQAIMRRLPCSFYIDLPGVTQREKILKVILRDEQIATDVNLYNLAKQLDHFNGSDIKEMCRTAALNRVRAIVVAHETDSDTGTIDDDDDDDIFIECDQNSDWKRITQQDFELAIDKMKKSKTQQFLVQAHDFAVNS